MGLGIADGYPGTIDGIVELKNRRGRNEFPIAEDVAARLISLPLHPFVKNEDIQEMVRLVMQAGR